MILYSGLNFLKLYMKESLKLTLSDWLTGEFLDEQYKGQRKLAGMLSTMRKTEGTHGKLTEFLMDKEFL
ncbi:hypothetical protein M8J76_010046 [Diaphorina citri]|nr:hypothetical protein M8J76_010046 [Diaphorina citri]